MVTFRFDPANHLGWLGGANGLHQPPDGRLAGDQVGVTLLKQGPDGARLATAFQKLGHFGPVGVQAGYIGLTTRTLTRLEPRRVALLLQRRQIGQRAGE